MRTSKFKEIPVQKRMPEYLIVAEKIKNKIKYGELKLGQALGSEAFMSEEFGVSRNIVKKGLAVLMNEGLIYSIPGKGNYVCDENFKLYELFFDEMMASDKKYEEVKVIDVNVIKPNSEISNNLDISGNKLVVVIKRVFISEKQVKIFDVKYIPYSRGVPIVELVTGNTPFPEMVSQKKSKFVMSKKLKIKAKLASGEVREIFDLAEGEAVLVVEQKQYDEKNNPIGWGIMYFPGDSSGLKAVASCY